MKLPTNRTQLFAYLDKLRKESPKKYAEIINEHEDDLFEVGYLRREMPLT